MIRGLTDKSMQSRHGGGSAPINIIGVPSGLNSGFFAEFWNAFFESIGFQVLLPPKTDARLIKIGCQISEPELCLPVKIYLAECQYLTQNGADVIFSPQYESVDRNIMNCPKIIVANDLARVIIRDLPPLLQPTIELDMGDDMISFESASKIRASMPLFFMPIHEYGQAYAHAVAASKREGRDLTRSRTKTRLALTGHRYIVNNNHHMSNILRALARNNIEWVAPENVGWVVVKHAYERIPLSQPIHWRTGREILGFVQYLAENLYVDGALYIAAFGCALDEVIEETARRIFSNHGIPYLFLTVDEHAHPGNLLLRLEAFLDLCILGDED